MTTQMKQRQKNRTHLANYFFKPLSIPLFFSVPTKVELFSQYPVPPPFPFSLSLPPAPFNLIPLYACIKVVSPASAWAP